MDSLKTAVSSLLESVESGKFIDDDSVNETSNGISLLALKNDALLSYISNLLLLAGAQLEQNSDVFNASRSRTIEQRVTLEKGIKGLEAKISYQIDKALRAHRRSIEIAEQEEKARDAAAAAAQDDSDSDLDATSFRPNLANLKKASGRSSGGYAGESDDENDDDKKRYVVPKISSTAPAFEKPRSAPKRRDFAMEEYLRESGDAPVAEPSIGSQIMDSGRGGERTERERRKDRDIQKYEESNFTRISNVSSKRARKDAFQRQRDATTRNFFGEDWGFLDSVNGSKNGKSKAKKRKT